MKVFVRIDDLGRRLQRAAREMREAARSGAAQRVRRDAASNRSRSVQQDEVSHDIVRPDTASRAPRDAQY